MRSRRAQRDLIGLRAILGAMNVNVAAKVMPTEDRDRVRLAVLNIFPDIELACSGNEVRGSTDSLERFAELIRSQRIRDSIRAQLLGSRTEKGLRLSLNKQAAFVGRVSIGEGSPLGDIEVSIECEDIGGLVDRIAPSTRTREKEYSRSAAF